MACLSADEVHKPPGDPQDKPHPLKIIINTKRKHQEPFWNSPKNLDSREKSHLWWAARFLYKEHNAKESIHLDLWLMSFGYLKFSGKYEIEFI